MTTARDFAEEAARILNGSMPNDEAATLIAAANACALTALALTATDPGAGLVVYAREGS